VADFKPSGIRASIVGNVSRAPEDKFNGSLTEVSVAVDHGYKKDGEWTKTGTTFVTYGASGDWAGPLHSLAVGDRVELADVALETRTYTKKDGTEGLAVNARFGTVTVLERKADREGGSVPAPSGFNTPVPSGF
jgi:hypothetical protein